MIKKLAKFIGQYKKRLFLAPIFVVGETLAELLLPYLMGKIVDVGIATGDTAYIFKIGAIMILLAIGGIVVGLLSARNASVASQGFGANLRMALFEKIQTFSFADVDRFSTASLVTRTTNDVKTLQQMVMMVTRMLLRAPALLIIALIICIRQNAKLALVYLVAIPVLLCVVLTIMKFTHHLFRLMQEKFDNLNASIQENLIAIRIVKSFVRMDHEKKKFKDANDDLTNTSITASMRIVIMNPSTTLILNLTTMAIIWFGGLMVGNGEMAQGQLMSFISYLNQILMSIMMFCMILMQATRARACAARCVEVLDHTPDIMEPKDAHISDAPLQGKIEFQNVSFKYPASKSDAMILDDISFAINPGEFVALVGSTGVGKTSLVSLIPRFYDAVSGLILVDDINVKNYDLTYLRQNIGVVLQNNLLFTGTIRENLRWGDLQSADKELMQVAKNCQAYEFINSFPDGLDTKIEQGGVNVSGGQKQRLCIGRAMLKKPPILILDDSTSAVDSATEGKIRETFYSEYKDTTVLLIAQRISSVQYADKIIVLDEGKISAVGRHDELMESSEVYQAIYESQQESEVLQDVG